MRGAGGNLRPYRNRITGANACPPEDIGGAPGYEEFLEAIRDPPHPEHLAMLQRCGGAFDPGKFDPMEAQERLDGICT